VLIIISALRRLLLLLLLLLLSLFERTSSAPRPRALAGTMILLRLNIPISQHFTTYVRTKKKNNTVESFSLNLIRGDCFNRNV
jgi:hypothetical protein